MFFLHHLTKLVSTSPSPRRAWIEISVRGIAAGTIIVALLAEGVDRNFRLPGANTIDPASPSSRRAWIEIMLGVAASAITVGRPPRGGRG